MAKLPKYNFILMGENYMGKRDKDISNKGFSLVELIIAIAIMAILVGALAPQLISYINKSRISSDIDKGASIASAVNIVMTDELIYNVASSQTIASLYSEASPDAFQAELKMLLGTNDAPVAKYGSNKDFYISISGTPKIVKIYAASDATDNDKMVYPEIGDDYK